MFPQLSEKLQEVFKELRGHGTLSEANIESALRHVRLALVEADVDFQVAKRFITQVKEKALGETVLRSITPGQQVVKVFHDELTALLGGDAATRRTGFTTASSDPPTGYARQRNRCARFHTWSRRRRCATRCCRRLAR